MSTPDVVMPGHYDTRLVALSVFIAVVASYTALDLAARVTSARGGARYLWVSSGATAKGIGLSSMHFERARRFNSEIYYRVEVRQGSFRRPIELVSVVQKHAGRRRRARFPGS